jgi:hypothetical protein
MAREAKYKIGDRVVFEFENKEWVGDIKDVKTFDVGYPSYYIYDLWFSELNIISKEE